jgi:hypothetical protein
MMRFKLSPTALVLVAFATCWTPRATASCTGSSPQWTASPDFSSVQTCVNNAVSGDTVSVSAGSATWSGRVQVTNKAINIIGAGTGNTVITGPPFEINNTQAPWNGSRISGFTLHMNGSYNIVQGEVGFRFDHIAMDNPNFGAEGVECTGLAAAPCEGLIDHATLTNARVIVFGEATPPGGTGGSTRWFEPLNEGTAHAVYVEDSTMINNHTQIANAMDSNLGGRYVSRFNTIVDAYLEFHSIQSDNLRGSRLMEAYDNTFTQDGNIIGFIRTMLLRAGTGMVFDNTFTGNWNSPSIDMDNVRTCHQGHDADFPVYGFCDGTGSVDGNAGGGAGYLCRDQPGASTDAGLWVGGNSPPAPSQARAPWFFFNNKNNGMEILQAHNTGSCENGTQVSNLKLQIVENRDFYQFQNSFDGTVGVGEGLLANRPSTCTVGVGYWATDQGEWNSQHAGADGELFTCTATNRWTMTYIPYTYPHPLQLGVNAPAPPSGLQAVVQ